MPIKKKMSAAKVAKKQSKKSAITAKSHAKKQKLPTLTPEPAPAKRKLLATSVPNENSTKKSKKQQKKDRKRKKNPDIFEISEKMKKIWEKYRVKDLPDETRRMLSSELRHLIKGNAEKLVLCHDTSRVIQSFVKYGSEEEREEVIEELKSFLYDICSKKYAKFYIVKLLKYGSAKNRQFVIGCLSGRILKLLKHKEASNIIEKIYNDHATLPERLQLLAEIYGLQYRLSRKNDKMDFLETCKAEPTLVSAMTTNLRDNLLPLLTKQCVRFSIIHKALFDLLSVISREDSKSVIEVCIEAVVHMLHTRDGVAAATKVWCLSSEPQRVEMLTTLSEYVVKVARDEHGFKFLIVICETLRDPDLLMTHVLQQLFASRETIEESFFECSSFRKTLLFTVLPRHAKLYSPAFIAFLDQARASSDENTVVDTDAFLRERHAFLFTVAAPFLCKFLHSNTTKLSESQSTIALIPMLLDAFKNTDHSDVFDRLIAIFFKRVVEDTLTPADASVGMTLKQVTLGDKFRRMSHTTCFSEKAIDFLCASENQAVLISFLENNRSIFFVIHLLESGATNADKLTKLITSSAKFVNTYRDKTWTGAKILAQKVATSS